jgi:hypothetical protein
MAIIAVAPAAIKVDVIFIFIPPSAALLDRHSRFGAQKRTAKDGIPSSGNVANGISTSNNFWYTKFGLSQKKLDLENQKYMGKRSFA